MGPMAVVPSPSVYRYNICNGLSNQLLYHSAEIAAAVKQGKTMVEIPNYFIVDGSQYTDENVLPSVNNSVPFGVAFDGDYFLEQVRQLGIEAKLVDFNFSSEQIACAGMISLQRADPHYVNRILTFFQPSLKMKELISGITSAFRRLGVDKGICVHHRDGEEWYGHCKRWSSINDGVYRGNCLAVPKRSFLKSLEDRGLSTSHWVYYCGDHHRVPKELRMSNYSIFSRYSLMSADDQRVVENITAGSSARNFWALLNMYACRKLKYFIGNSVSTFSSMQIAYREGENSFWYNSQSIPLGAIWNVYHVPIVYTYTEMSSEMARHLLQTSIASVRHHMPRNKIHVLYHGKADKDLRSWLSINEIIIHDHDPDWRGMIEFMRRHGDPRQSQNYHHEGDFFGEWQQIDIPLMINSEYCLHLGADTMVASPFTMANLGLNLTKTIAITTTEAGKSDVPFQNSGAMLINVPRMRETYDGFLEFIMKHAYHTRFNRSAPFRRGAYLDYYGNEICLLSPSFNHKPDLQVENLDSNEPFIVHFYGPKPHDYLSFILENSCYEPFQSLCIKMDSMPDLCHWMQVFAKFSKKVHPVAYCQISFKNHTLERQCHQVLDALSELNETCTDLKRLVNRSVCNLPCLAATGRDNDGKSMYGEMRQPNSPGNFPIMFSVVFLMVVLRQAMIQLKHWRNQSPEKTQERHQKCPHQRIWYLFAILVVWLSASAILGFTWLESIWNSGDELIDSGGVLNG